MENFLDTNASLFLPSSPVTSSSSSSPFPKIEDLLSGIGNLQGAHLNKQFSEIADGIMLGSEFGVEDLIAQTNLKLLIRMNAKENEPPYRIIHRTFSSSSSSASFKASWLTDSKKFQEYAVSEETWYEKLQLYMRKAEPPEYDHEWRTSECIFIRSIAAIDEPGHPIFRYFDETSHLIEAVRSVREEFKISANQPKDRLTEFLAEQQQQQQQKNEKSASNNNNNSDLLQNTHIDKKRRWLPTIAVNCHVGASRSASVVIAWALRLTRHHDVRQVVKLVKAKRQVVEPNSGFFTQLRRHVATNFLPLHQPHKFASEMAFIPSPRLPIRIPHFERDDDEIEQQEADDEEEECEEENESTTDDLEETDAYLILQRALKFSLESSRRDIDFFSLCGAVNSRLQQQQQKEQNNSSNNHHHHHARRRIDGFKMILDTFDRLLLDERDVDAPSILSNILHHLQEFFQKSPQDVLEHCAANRILKSSSSSSSRFVFSDSAVRFLLTHFVFRDREEKEKEIEQEHEYTKKKSKKKKKKRGIEFERDPPRDISRALKLCRLFQTSVSQLTFFFFPTTPTTSSPEELNGMLKQVCQSFRTSFSFMPLLVSYHVEFWSTVYDFIQDNADPEGGLNLINNLIRTPAAGGGGAGGGVSESMKGAGYLSSMMLSSGSIPVAPDPSQNSHFAHAHQTSSSASTSSSNSSLSNLSSWTATRDPEIDLFVFLARSKAMLEGREKFILNLRIWMVSAAALYFPRHNNNNSQREEDKEQEEEEAVEFEKLSLMMEKVCGTLVSVAMLLSPATHKPSYYLQQQEGEKEEEQKVSEGIADVLSFIFSSEKKTEKEGEEDLDKLLHLAFGSSVSSPPSSSSDSAKSWIDKWLERLCVEFSEKRASLVWQKFD